MKLPSIVFISFVLLSKLGLAEDEQWFHFRDVSSESGIESAASGIRGHAAGWGDANGDGWPDLYIGTFHNGDTKPNMLLWNEQGKFKLDDQSELRVSARSNAALFVDFDNDGDLDLYVASMPAVAGSSLAVKEGRELVPCSLFRNNGNGDFENISNGNGACPAAFGGRSATVLDFDGDGLLDLLVGEDPLSGYNGSPTHSSRLFRNLGNLQFEDASQKAGLPNGVPGLGVVAADFNNDRWPDIFLASHRGGNVLLINNGRGEFKEPSTARQIFAWANAGGDNMICGVAAGDMNRDGWMDIVLGQHFDSPWRNPVANRLYLNRGLENEELRFEDVTESVGLIPLPMKSPHVELEDFDNDGWPDLYCSIVKFSGDRPHPVIFKHLGIQDGLPRFNVRALQVNGFPNEEERAAKRSGTLFEKIIRERTIFYAAPGPSADYDLDGRLDLFLASWWPEAPSLLLRNETSGGNWLRVDVHGRNAVNRMGVGSRVNVYEANRLGEPAALIGTREIMIGYGYVSGHAPIAHFGLGNVTQVDLEIHYPNGKGTATRVNVAANQRIVIE